MFQGGNVKQLSYMWVLLQEHKEDGPSVWELCEGQEPACQASSNSQVFSVEKCTLAVFIANFLRLESIPHRQ